MQKTILITGSTDGIGYETAKRFVREGHNVIIHGRNAQKVQKVKAELLAELGEGSLESFVADLSSLAEVKRFSDEVKIRYSTLDVIINNAGVYKTPESKTVDGFDIRFAVNTIAPYLLTKLLDSLLDETSRVVNLSSAAQAPVSINALKSYQRMSEGEAYAQSKLALTMWTNALSSKHSSMLVSINPKSFLGTKMVKEAYGMQGVDLNIGADILKRAALSDEFNNASGQYFDNDIGRFSSPHGDALNTQKCNAVVEALEEIVKDYV